MFECVCVCVCVIERGRERGRECVCVFNCQGKYDKHLRNWPISVLIRLKECFVLIVRVTCDVSCVFFNVTPLSGRPLSGME